MPLVQDYSDDEEQDGAPSGGGRPSGGGGGAVRQAQATPQQESAFVPWSRFASANADVSAREAGKLQSQVQGDVDRAQGEREQAGKEQKRAIESNYDAGPMLNASSFGAPAQMQQQPQGATGGFGSAQGGFGRNAPAPAQKPTTAMTPGASANASLAADAPRRGPLGGLSSDKLYTKADGSDFKTEGANLAGGKSLEEQIGKDAWSKLLGDTAKAQSEAKALGSDAGVQGLLQQQTAGPLAQGGAFDAALLSGAGGKGFQDLSRQYGGDQLGKALLGESQSAQDRWHKLMGDVQSAAGARDKQIGDYRDEWNREMAGGFVPQAPEAGPVAPKGGLAGFENALDFLNGGKNTDTTKQKVHETAMTISPADALAKELGKNGINIGKPSESFAGAFGADGGDDWAQGNFRNALRDAYGKYGPKAIQDFWSHLTPEMWAEYKQYNSGVMLRMMQQWLDSAGYKPLTTEELVALHEASK